MKQFAVRCTFTDRRMGPGIGRTLQVESSNITGAIGKAVRQFWCGLNRKERFDARNTMKIEPREVV